MNELYITTKEIMAKMVNGDFDTKIGELIILKHIEMPNIFVVKDKGNKYEVEMDTIELYDPDKHKKVNHNGFTA